MTTTLTQSGDIVKTPSNEVVASTSELDAAVARILDLKQATWASAWRIGKELDAVKERQLWKLRLGQDGKPLYKTFETFVRAETRISEGYANKLIQVSAAFGEDEVAKFGARKLSIVCEVPDEEAKKRLLSMTASGTTVRKLQEEARVVKEQQRQALRSQGVTPTTRGQTASGNRRPRALTGNEGRPTEKVTISALTGKKEVDLWRTPKAKGENAHEKARTEEFFVVIDGVGGKKKLIDPEQKPWGKMELENRVTMYFRIQTRPSGDLFLQIATERKPEE